MVAEIIIGAGVGTATLYWSLRRLKFIGAYWRAHRNANHFERALRQAREELSAENPFRISTAADADLVALLHVVKPDEAELEACGFTRLGDLVVQAADQPATAVIRALVDRSATTCAFLLVTPRSPTSRRLGLSSYRDDEMFTTRRAPFSTLADPPFVHRQLIAAPRPCAELVSHHRTLAHLDEAGASFIQLTSLDGLIAELAKFRAKVVRWRDAQPSDELLDADLRAVLGDAYAKAGKVWARRLRGRIPQATVRR